MNMTWDEIDPVLAGLAHLVAVAALAFRWCGQDRQGAPALIEQAGPKDLMASAIGLEGLRDVVFRLPLGSCLERIYPDGSVLRVTLGDSR